MSRCFLLITMDECRYDALSCYGGTAISTPHMDSLAKSGILFKHALTPSPVCLPARCALLSGQYPHRTGMVTNTIKRLLAPETPNIFNIAQSSGWRTAMVGKCHFTATPYAQLKYGEPFDGSAIRAYLLSLGIDQLALCDGKVATFWFWDEYSRALKEAGLFEQVAYPGKPADARIFTGPDEWHPDYWVGQQAVNFLSEHDAEQPLLLWVSFPGPHYPHDPPESYLNRVDKSQLPILRWREGEFDGNDKAHCRSFRRELEEERPPWGCEGGAHPGGTSRYTDQDWKEIQLHYLANVALIDDAVGAVLAAAHDRFGDNLDVVLTADHGDMMGAHRLWGKGSCAYEEVIKVPFLTAGPSFVLSSGQGQTTNARVSLLDILPTICGIVGVEMPARYDGRDIRQSLHDGGHELLFSSVENLIIVDDGRWRLSINQVAQTTELYNLRNDPGEYENLAHLPEGQSARSRLERALLDHLITSTLGPVTSPVPTVNNFLPLVKSSQN